MDITLESLLDGTGLNGGYDYSHIDGDDVDILAVECFDLLAEVSDISANLTTFEAAKKIKKTASKKRKVKVKKTKTTAKKARGKGKKVRREEDDVEADNASGNSNDTPVGDLDESKLASMPDDAQVTEIEPDTSDAGVETSDDVATEGYMIVYEDSAILALEDGEKKEKSKFMETIKKWWNKFVDFVVGLWRKFITWWDGDEKLLKKAGDEVEKNLKSTEMKVKCRKYTMKPSAFISEILKVLGELANNICDGKEKPSITVFGTDVKEIDKGDIYKAFDKKLYGTDKPEKKEMTLKDASEHVGTKKDIEEFFKTRNEYYKIQEKIKSKRQEVLKNLSESDKKDDEKSESRTNIKVNAKFLSKFTAVFFKYYKNIRVDMRKIVKKAGKVSDDDKSVNSKDDK